MKKSEEKGANLKQSAYYQTLQEITSKKLIKSTAGRWETCKEYFFTFKEMEYVLYFVKFGLMDKELRPIAVEGCGIKAEQGYRLLDDKEVGKLLNSLKK